MGKFLFSCVLVASMAFPSGARSQDAASQAAGKPTEHLLGTITRVDAGAHTITVKDDKSSTEYAVSVAGTRTLLKVAPGAKDLKSATRITAEDLEPGDRVDVRGFNGDTPNSIAARSVVLMSGRDLLQHHRAESAAWQNSINGTVTAVDAAARTLSISARGPEGPKPLTVQMPASVDFTRYSPDNPKAPAPSQISEIHPGDQVRVIGQKSDDGASVTAQKVYSGSFRTVAGTISSISPDGKHIALKDLQSKQTVQVVLTSDATVRKLPPEMAAALARRFNPSTVRANPDEHAQGQGQGPGPGRAQDASAPPEGGGMRRSRGGDLSQMLSHVPEINVSELKNGDAVVVSGAAGNDPSQLIATNVIAGVEPIFQAAPPRQGQSLGDWGLDMSVPAQ